MKLLLDTHAFLWFIAGDTQLSDYAPEHLDTLYTLPYHHKDPFDRLIIAQGMSEDMSLITRDPAFDACDVRVAWSQ